MIGKEALSGQANLQLLHADLQHVDGIPVPVRRRDA
jgi:hypothetical protein